MKNRQKCTQKSTGFARIWGGHAPTHALRFLASLPLSVPSSTLYATSLIALYVATLPAFTSAPLKARRDPTLAFEYDAS